MSFVWSNDVVVRTDGTISVEATIEKHLSRVREVITNEISEESRIQLDAKRFENIFIRAAGEFEKNQLPGQRLFRHYVDGVLSHYKLHCSNAQMLELQNYSSDYVTRIVKFFLLSNSSTEYTKDKKFILSPDKKYICLMRKPDKYLVIHFVHNETDQSFTSIEYLIQDEAGWVHPKELDWLLVNQEDFSDGQTKHSVICHKIESGVIVETIGAFVVCD